MLRPELILSGRVVDSEGSPVVGAQASVIRWLEGPRPGVVILSSQSSELGEFAIPGFEPSANSLLRVMSEGLGTILLPIHVNESETGNHDFGDLVMHPAGWLRGRVLDSQGEGIPGFEITSVSDSLGGSDSPGFRRVVTWLSASERRVSSFEGAFTFEGLTPGSYVVRAELKESGQDWSRETRVVIPPGPVPAEVDFVFGSGASLAGRLLGSSGLPIEGAYLILYPDTAQLSNAVGRASTGPGGGFRFHDLAPGWYRIGAQVPAELRGTKADDGSSGALFDGLLAGTEDLVLTLPKAEFIRGYVVDPDDTAVEGAFVYALQGGLIIDWCRTESTGRFELEVGDYCDLTAIPSTVVETPTGEMDVADKRPERRRTLQSIGPGASDLIIRLPFAGE